ncbi:amino acid ABC transporter permease [Phenylobacterium sp. 58.2.17]|uniref:amino acid ABC transporter permease n=1 Tax=Phenylobacterium sp. 58.2.17 TaxID=2969306 RepID=UPI0022642984|nr:amino acid ABC transporter permease [Phenylobacterium sp. 58.2.17]MCX7587268.1 amino acid ABC transporter permease [Phenylobacterium sp. 58.2.17]
MTDAVPPTVADVFVRTETLAGRPAPKLRRASLLGALFGDAATAAASLLIGAMLLVAVPKLLAWGVLNGVWSGDGEACTGVGACWAFLREKHPQILFGIYPPAEQWRPVLVVAVFLALALWSLPPRNWTRATLAAWFVGALAALVLMGGGLFGLEAVPTSDWGGLPMTLLLTVASLGLGFPLAVVLALGRQSTLPVTRVVCVTIIEVVRGLPLLSILFVASIMLPLMLPDGVTVDKLLRAIVALTVFSAAYIAEVLRGGLQALPPGQTEAARALGLNWLQTTWLIVLPQALGKVIPPLTNTVVVIVKNTSLVLVVGLFDLLSSGRAALADPAWPAPYAETYLFIALIYFVICFGISRYALWLERRMSFGAAR